MNLKPFRDYSEHEVVNLFAAQEGELAKGTFVSMVAFDPDNHNSLGDPMPYLPFNAHTFDYVVNARVSAAATMSGVLGITLFDVKTNLPFKNEPANLADPVRLAEQQVVPSGRAVPVLKRGIVEIGGFSGTPFPGAKGIIATGSGSVAGQLVVAPASTVNNVGTFLSSAGVDGYAIFQVNCA
jgi:hypothetical protein